MKRNFYLVYGMSLLLGDFSEKISFPAFGWDHAGSRQLTTAVSGPSIIKLLSGPAPGMPVTSVEPIPSGSLSEQKENRERPEKAPKQNQEPSSQKAPILVPEHPGQDNGQVIVSYKSKVEETQKLLRMINEEQLTKEQHDTYISINSFLEKAREAFSQDDMPMAVNLAEKAHTLAKEIVNNSTKP